MILRNYKGKKLAILLVISICVNIISPFSTGINIASAAPVISGIDFDIAGVNTTRITPMDGSEPDGYSESPTISSDGRYIAFKSRANNLSAEDNMDEYDIFVHDRQTNETELVSYNEYNQQFDYIIPYYPQISPDGNYVAFTAGAGCYLRDRIQDKTYKIADIYTNWFPSISGDNRYIVYSAGYTSNVYFYDRGLDLVDSGDDTTIEIGLGFRPSISKDGRYVVYQSDNKIYLYNVENKTIKQVDLNLSGEPSNGSSGLPDISADGRFISFESTASDLTTDSLNASQNMFIHDRDLDSNGIFDESGTTSIELVSQSSEGISANGRTGSGGIEAPPRISEDGRYVIFKCAADNLVPQDTNDDQDLFVRDVVAGKTIRVNMSSEGEQAETTIYGAAYPDISVVDGNITVVYDSSSSNLVPNDNNDDNDIFIGEIFEDYRPNLSSDQPLEEHTLDQRVLTIELLNDTFIDSTLETGNFILNNTPNEGVKVNSVDYISDTQCAITLGFDGTDFDNSISDFSITILANELDNTTNLTTKTLPIAGEIEYGTFEFAQSNYSVNENVGTVTIEVLRTNGTDGNVGLSYSFENDTANSGEDYLDPIWSNNVSFSEGETSKTFDVTIYDNDDGVDSSSETFVIYLYRGEMGLGTIGDQNMTTVTIIEDGAISPLAINSGTLTDGMENQGYNHTFTATGGTGSYSYSMTSGNLPAGLTLGNNGLLSGIPTEYGTFTFTVEVNDGANVNNHQFTLDIIEELKLDTTELSSGIEGDIYTHDFAATGGVPPYTYSITNGILPNALTLDGDGTINGIAGRLDGVPQMIGTFTFTIQVSDSAGIPNTDSREFTLTILEFADDIVPVWPVASQVTTSNLSTDRLTLSWTGATDNVGVTKYKVLQDGSEIDVVNSGQLSYNVSGLAPDTSYTFKIEAGDGSNNWTTNGPTCTISTNMVEKPVAPGSLNLQVISYNQINLQWQDNSDNEDGFIVEKSLDEATWNKLVETNMDTTNYSDSGLSASTTYYYRVCAYNSQGDSAYSEVAKAETHSKTAPLPINPPSPRLRYITIESSMDNLQIGKDTSKLEVIAYYSDGDKRNVTHSADIQVSDSSIARIKENEVKPLSVGAVTITANYKSRAASTTVTVFDTMKLELEAQQRDIYVGESSASIIGTLVLSDGTKENVTNLCTWSTSNPDVAEISDIGLLIPKSGGTVAITAAYGNLTKQITITIIGIESIEISPSNADMIVGQQPINFTANARYTDGLEKDVTEECEWNLSDYKYVGIIDNGVVEARQAGTAILESKVGDIIGTSEIRVSELAITPPSETLFLNSPVDSSGNPIFDAKNSIQLQATVKRSDGTELDVTSNVQWLISDPEVASIDSSGRLQAVKEGSVIVSASYENHLQTALFWVVDDLIIPEIEMLAAWQNPDQAILRWAIKDGWLPAEGLDLYRIRRDTRGSEVTEKVSTIGSQVQLKENVIQVGNDIIPMWNLSEKAVLSSEVLESFELVNEPEEMMDKALLEEIINYSATGEVYQDSVINSGEDKFKNYAPVFTGLFSSIGDTIDNNVGDMKTVTQIQKTSGESEEAIENNTQYTNSNVGLLNEASIEELDSIRATRGWIQTAANLDIEFAQKSGFGYVDALEYTSNDMGTEIQYMLIPAGLDIDALINSDLDLPLCSVEMGIERLPESPEGLDGYGMDGEVDLRWNIPLDIQSNTSNISGYNIERKLNEEIDFRVINDNPVVIGFVRNEQGQWEEPAVFFSDILENGEQAEYRIRAIDVFGRQSQPSDTIEIIVKKTIPPISPELQQPVIDIDLLDANERETKSTEIIQNKDMILNLERQLIIESGIPLYTAASNSKYIAVPFTQSQVDDVTEYRIYRSAALGSGEFDVPQLLSSFDANTFNNEFIENNQALMTMQLGPGSSYVFYDAQVQPGHFYKYWIAAVDSWQNESAWSDFMVAGYPADHNPDAVNNISATFEEITFGRVDIYNATLGTLKGNNNPPGYYDRFNSSMIVQQSPADNIDPIQIDFGDPGYSQQDVDHVLNVAEMYTSIGDVDRAQRAMSLGNQLQNMVNNPISTKSASSDIQQKTSGNQQEEINPKTEVYYEVDFEQICDDWGYYDILTVNTEDLNPDGSIDLMWNHKSTDDYLGYRVFATHSQMDLSNPDFLSDTLWSSDSSWITYNNRIRLQVPETTDNIYFLVCTYQIENEVISQSSQATENQVEISGNTAGYVTVTWDLVKDPQVRSFKVYRAEVDDSTTKVLWTLVDDRVTGNEYKERVDQSKVHYYRYKIVTEDVWGQKSLESESQQVRIPTTISPESPQLYTPRSDTGEIKVRWSPVDDATHYIIYRTEIPLVKAKEIDETISGVLELAPESNDKQMSKSDLLTLKEKLDTLTQEQQIAVLNQIIAQHGPLALTTYGQLDKESAGDVEWYEKATLKVNNLGSDGFALENGVLTWVDDDVVYPQKYLYTVASVNQDKLVSDRPQPVSAMPRKGHAPPAPTLSATISSDDPQLTWSPYDPEMNITESMKQTMGYVIFRSNGQNETYYQISSLLNEEQYTDTSAQPGATYWYTVKIIDEAGFVSKASSPRSVTVPSTGGSSTTIDPSQLQFDISKKPLVRTIGEFTVEEIREVQMNARDILYGTDTFYGGQISVHGVIIPVVVTMEDNSTEIREVNLFSSVNLDMGTNGSVEITEFNINRRSLNAVIDGNVKVPDSQGSGLIKIGFTNGTMVNANSNITDVQFEDFQIGRYVLKNTHGVIIPSSDSNTESNDTILGSNIGTPVQSPVSNELFGNTNSSTLQTGVIISRGVMELKLTNLDNASRSSESLDGWIVKTDGQSSVGMVFDFYRDAKLNSDGLLEGEFTAQSQQIPLVIPKDLKINVTSGSLKVVQGEIDTTLSNITGSVELPFLAATDSDDSGSSQESSSSSSNRLSKHNYSIYEAEEEPTLETEQTQIIQLTSIQEKTLKNSLEFALNNAIGQNYQCPQNGDGINMTIPFDVSSWDGLGITTTTNTIQPICIGGGYLATSQHIVVDLSTEDAPISLRSSPQWQGLSLENVVLTLPEEFSNNEQLVHVPVNQDFFYEPYGLTGYYEPAQDDSGVNNVQIDALMEVGENSPGFPAELTGISIDLYGGMLKSEILGKVTVSVLNDKKVNFRAVSDDSSGTVYYITGEAQPQNQVNNSELAIVIKNGRLQWSEDEDPVGQMIVNGTINITNVDGVTFDEPTEFAELILPTQINMLPTEAEVDAQGDIDEDQRNPYGIGLLIDTPWADFNNFDMAPHHFNLIKGQNGQCDLILKCEIDIDGLESDTEEADDTIYIENLFTVPNLIAGKTNLNKYIPYQNILDIKAMFYYHENEFGDGEFIIDSNLSYFGMKLIGAEVLDDITFRGSVHGRVGKDDSSGNGYWIFGLTGGSGLKASEIAELDKNEKERTGEGLSEEKKEELGSKIKLGPVEFSDLVGVLAYNMEIPSKVKSLERDKMKDFIMERKYKEEEMFFLATASKLEIKKIIEASKATIIVKSGPDVRITASSLKIKGAPMKKANLDIRYTYPSTLIASADFTELKPPFIEIGELSGSIGFKASAEEWYIRIGYPKTLKIKTASPGMYGFGVGFENSEDSWEAKAKFLAGYQFDLSTQEDKEEEFIYLKGEIAATAEIKVEGKEEEDNSEIRGTGSILIELEAKGGINWDKNKKFDIIDVKASALGEIIFPDPTQLRAKFDLDYKLNTPLYTIKGSHEYEVEKIIE